MMMLGRHVSRRLAAYIDGELPAREAQHIGRHLERCVHCQADFERLKFAMSAMEQVRSVAAPESVWSGIDAHLRFHAPTPLRTHAPIYAPTRLALAAGAALVLASTIVVWRITYTPGTRWQVQRLEGSPAVGARHISGMREIKAGEWIETDSGSRASVKVGEIGSVEVSPNTRVRVIAARANEHRLALARGEIRASISAPPRLFFVDTAAGTAVDLGCEYVLNTDEDGFGMLRVTKGWVSFQWKGLESLVPAGASCGTRPRAGPGIPYFDDAPENLKQALESFAFEKAGNEALSMILAESRVRDTLTLWHLLSRVEAGDRTRVYDRIAALAPVPAGVSREKALKLDPETLNRWKEELAWTW